MRKIRRVKKARKIYGAYKGDSFLTLFYSYCLKARAIGEEDHGRALSEFRTAFNQYVLRKYGRQFYDEYCVFHMLNKDNKTLIRAMDKKQTVFLNREILGLPSDPKEYRQKPEDGREGQKAKEESSGTAAAQTVVAQTSLRPVQPVVRGNPYVDYTAGRIYDTLPARNIDYIPPSFSKRSYKITMRRLADGSEFVVYHLGKNADEAMMLANRHSFDSARIIKVEEE